MDYKISQNFIKDRILINTILKKTDITKADTVLDIGAGSGALIKPLSSICKDVIAYEIDPKLIDKLSKIKQEDNMDNVSIENRDFLTVDLGGLGEYKVFSNIPFSRSAAIIKKLLIDGPFPKTSYLFLEKNTAYRFLGINGESIISLSIKIDFSSRIIHQFDKHDFMPVPEADIVLAEFKRRGEEDQLLGIDDTLGFIGFVNRIFLQKKHDLKGALLTCFTYNQVKRIKHDLGLDIKVRSSEVNIMAWVKIYDVWKKIGKDIAS